MPPWLKWALIFFIGYAILIAPHRPQTRQAYEKAAQNLSPNSLFHMDQYKNQIFPSAPIRITEDAPGKGDPAACGQDVSIAYTSFLPDGKPTGDSADQDKPLTFRLGDNKVMPALEQAVLGMKPDSKRTAVAPGTLAYGAGGFANAQIPPDTSIRFEVQLLSASPSLPDGPFRIAVTQQGSGNAITCGDTAKVQVTVWDTQGKQLYASQDPISFTVGKGEVFLGLEQGVLGMQTNARRTLIVPPAFQKTLSGDAPTVDIPLPGDQTVLVDVTALP